MIINNIGQLKKELNKRLVDAVAILTDQIYEKLIYFIEEDIYKTYTPNYNNPNHYMRTYDFRDRAWQSYYFEVAGEIAGIIQYTPEAMFYNPSLYQHGNRQEDRREKLAEILNRGTADWDDWDFGRHNGSEGYSSYPKPFWDDTINWIVKNWDKLAKEALRKAGINAI